MSKTVDGWRLRWHCVEAVQLLYSSQAWGAAVCSSHHPSLATTCRSEFVFINPNAKGTCGCGESFTVDPKQSKQNAAAVGGSEGSSSSGGAEAAAAGGQS